MGDEYESDNDSVDRNADPSDEYELIDDDDERVLMERLFNPFEDLKSAVGGWKSSSKVGNEGFDPLANGLRVGDELKMDCEYEIVEDLCARKLVGEDSMGDCCPLGCDEEVETEAAAAAMSSKFTLDIDLCLFKIFKFSA